jgi:hypothetical protein
MGTFTMVLKVAGVVISIALRISVLLSMLGAYYSGRIDAALFWAIFFCGVQLGGIAGEISKIHEKLGG